MAKISNFIDVKDVEKDKPSTHLSDIEQELPHNKKFNIVGKSNWHTIHRLLVVSLSVNILLILITLFFAGKRYYYSHPDTFKSLNSVRIVALGDSRVSGANWNNILYRNDVMNCGIGGLGTKQLIKKLDTAYIYKPFLSIIQIGINDIRNNIGNDSIFFFYTQIIDSLRRHKIQPIVTSIIPLRADYCSDLVDYKVVNARVDSLNFRLVNFCKEIGIQYININKNIIDSNYRLKREYTWDGIHLNDSGYILAGQEIKRYLKVK